MFEQTFIDGKQDAERPYTIVLSLLLQIALMGVVILIPLIYSEALPSAQLKSMVVAPAPPRPPTPQTKVASTAVQTRAVRRLLAERLVAPSFVPRKVNDIERDAPDIRVPGTSFDAGGRASGVIASILGPAASDAPPLFPLAKAKQRSGPIRVGGRIAAANLMRKVQPAYPPLAKSARVQGTVEFTATISKDGRIENLQLIGGHPLLVNAAKEAVLQWRYKPTLLNGEPVEVVTDILVNFTLQP